MFSGTGIIGITESQLSPGKTAWGEGWGVRGREIQLGFTAITQVSFNKYLTKSGGDIKREQKKERAQKRISGDIQGMEAHGG